MRIATWNVNSLKARLPRVEEFLGYADVDVLCLQETKLSDKTFPALHVLGPRLRVGAQRTGPVERRRDPVARRDRRTSTTDSTTRTSIPTKATRGSLTADVRRRAASSSVYVPNGREVGTEFYDRKLVWLATLHDWLAAKHTPDDPLVIARRLQRRTRGPRRLGPEGVRRRDPRHRPERDGGRAARASGAWRTCSGACIPTHDRLYTLLGLPRRRLPPAPRHAHRPRARDEAGRRARHVGGRRPQRAQGHRTVRPRARDRRPRATSSHLLDRRRRTRAHGAPARARPPTASRRTRRRSCPRLKRAYEPSITHASLNRPSTQ